MDSNSSSSEKSLTGKAIAGVGWSTLANVGRQVLSFASVALLARLLDASAYGLMGMATLVTGILVNFRDLGTAAAIVQRPTVTPRLLSSLFWVNMIMGALLFLLVLAAAEPTARLFENPQVAPILRTLAISFWLASATAVHSALLTRQMRFDLLALADIGSALAGYAVSIPCALNGFGVWSLVYANITNAAVLAVLTFAFSRWRPSLVFDMREVRSIAGFSLNFSAFGIINYFGRNADNLIVGKFLGPAQLGFYQMAYNLMLYPIQNISSIIAQVLFPSFAKIQHDNPRFRSAYLRSCLLLALVTFPIMVGLGILAEPFILVMLGPRWAPAIPVFRVLAAVGVLQSVQTTVGQIYVAKGRTDWMFYVGAANTALGITAFLVGIQYGILGVAVAYAAVYFSAQIFISLLPAFRLIELPLRDFARALLPQLAFTLVMAAGCLLGMRLLDALALHSPVLRLAFTIPLGASIYIFLFLRLRPPVMEHLENIVRQDPGSRLGRLAARATWLFPAAR